MNHLEKEMIEILKKLRDNHGAFELKAEYENEGSRQDELMRLKDIGEKVGMPIILKIGGVEAITDIYSALTLGVKGIIAPMAETPFALSKFLDAIETFIPEDNREDIEFAVNIETITAYENFSKMLQLKKIKHLQSITVGRVDFTASMGKDRSIVDGDEMMKYCTDIFSQSKALGLKTALGGAISTGSIPFVSELSGKGLLNKFETRKLVYRQSTDAQNMLEGIMLGIEFELLWLKSKRRYYHRIKSEDEKRIEMLEKRVNAAKEAK